MKRKIGIVLGYAAGAILGLWLFATFCWMCVVLGMVVNKSVSGWIAFHNFWSP